MKRLTAILLLCVLLFNLYGYRLVINYLQQEHETRFTAQLDSANYADEDLISIKTPLSLPYYNRTLAFERVDGSIRIDGVVYRYVKRRIINDSLELLCLPNAVTQKLQTAKSDFFKITNDLPEGNKKPAQIIKTTLPEYCNALTDYNFEPFFNYTPAYPVRITQLRPVHFALVQERPPELARLDS